MSEGKEKKTRKRTRSHTPSSSRPKNSRRALISGAERNPLRQTVYTHAWVPGYQRGAEGGSM